MSDTCAGGSDRLAFTSHLRKQAEGKRHDAIRTLAAALAVEDGELTPSEAKDWLSLESDLERVQSSRYPGDEYINQATLQLENGGAL